MRCTGARGTRGNLEVDGTLAGEAASVEADRHTYDAEAVVFDGSLHPTAAPVASWSDAACDNADRDLGLLRQLRWGQTGRICRLERR